MRSNLLKRAFESIKQAADARKDKPLVGYARAAIGSSIGRISRLLSKRGTKPFGLASSRGRQAQSSLLAVAIQPFDLQPTIVRPGIRAEVAKPERTDIERQENEEGLIVDDRVAVEAASTHRERQVSTSSHAST